MSVGPTRSGDLGVTVSFAPSGVLIAVRGELDMTTAPDLRAVLDAVVDRGHAEVVLDLGDVGFIDAQGLEVIAATASGLGLVGGVCTLRSTPPRTRRILEITKVSDLVRFEASDPPRAQLGPEQLVGDGSAAVSSPPHPRADSSGPDSSGPEPGGPESSGVAGFAGSGAIDAGLRLVVALASATVGGADGVSVSLSRHGRIETVASSDDTIAQMDRDQYATGEGPCLSAAAQGHWFHVESLAEEHRWAEFTPRALRDGIASILSTPLMVADRPVGSLNIYSRVERAFGPAEQELAALFADQASGLLADTTSHASAEPTGDQMRRALRSREVIAQAEGVLMGRVGVSAQQASSALRRSARETGMLVRAMAAELVTSTSRDDGSRPHG